MHCRRFLAKLKLIRIKSDGVWAFGTPEREKSFLNGARTKQKWYRRNTTTTWGDRKKHPKFTVIERDLRKICEITVSKLFHLILPEALCYIETKFLTPPVPNQQKRSCCFLSVVFGGPLFLLQSSSLLPVCQYGVVRSGQVQQCGSELDGSTYSKVSDYPQFLREHNVTRHMNNQTGNYATASNGEEPLLPVNDNYGKETNPGIKKTSSFFMTVVYNIYWLILYKPFNWQYLDGNFLQV